MFDEMPGVMQAWRKFEFILLNSVSWRNGDVDVFD